MLFHFQFWTRCEKKRSFSLRHRWANVFNIEFGGDGGVMQAGHMFAKERFFSLAMGRDVAFVFAHVRLLDGTLASIMIVD